MKTVNERPETLEQTSAGGVAYRETGGGLEVAVILTNPENRWQLPKGMIDAGETPEIAARREIREEAGIETKLVAPIDRTEYWFMADRAGKRTRFHKRVHWFLMQYVTGDVADHDHEVKEARWVTADEAVEMLVFKNEREIVEKAVAMIGRNGKPE